MAHCQQKIGEAYFRTPRTTITAFVNLLAILEQYPEVNWRDSLCQVDVQKDTGGTADFQVEPEGTQTTMIPGPADDEFASFKLQ
jgi:hypothetical protein